MADFIGTYRLAQNPPEEWRHKLASHASSHGLELRSTTSPGSRQVTVTVRVPKDAQGPSGEGVIKFFLDATKILSKDQGTAARAELTEFKPADTFWDGFIRLIGSIQFIVTISFTFAVAVGISDRGGPFLGNDVSKIIFAAGTSFVSIGFLVRIYRNLSIASSNPAPTGLAKTLLAAKEQDLAREAAQEEDPKTQARIELARIRLRARTGGMRSDADRLWRRSFWASTGAFGFFILSVAIGPGVAARLVLNEIPHDWRYMLGGLCLASVPLAIGTALLRHDTKLREQCQEVARDVASLERYELALDYSQLASLGIYHKTIHQVIAQLLLNRVPPSLGSSNSLPQGEAAEDSAGILETRKIIGLAVDKAVDVLDAVVPKKGGGG